MCACVAPSRQPAKTLPRERFCVAGLLSCAEGISGRKQKKQQIEKETERVRETYNDTCGPWIEQQDGAHQEGAGQDYADGQQEPVAQADVLLPEEERVAIRIVPDALAHELLTDRAHAFDSLNEIRGLPEAVQVEGKLSKLQGFSSRDWKERTDRL